jgi:hypothetical protein
MAAPDEDGVPLIEHLRSAERQTGRTPEALLAAPPCPVGCEELWHIFGQLHGCRGSTGFGPARISYLDLDAYQRVTGTKLVPWEVEAIRRADRAYLSDWAERQPKNA